MKSVFFAVPAYRGVRCVPFFESLEKTVYACEAAGWKTALSVLQGSCYIQTARNELIQAFWESEYDCLFFLDDDLVWDCENALQLLEMDDEIVCGIYPNKTEEEKYPVVVNTLGIENNFVPKVRDDGCISAVLVPTGFMRVKRSVIEKLRTSYPEQMYDNLNKDFTTKKLFDLFPQGVHNGRWWGEDFAFCRLWQNIGGEVWVVPNITFSHIDFDDKQFIGNYHEFLLKQPGGLNYTGEGEHDYSGNFIEGWMNINEQRWLYDKGKYMDEIAEIGSFKGRSSHAIISGGPKKLHCIDSWKPMKIIHNDSEEKAERRYQEFLSNINNISNNGTEVIVHRMDSHNAAELFSDKSLDMVFIDADHDYESVINDIKIWKPKARKLLCGHDYNWPDVKRAVNDALKNVEIYESIWIYPIEE